MDFQDPGGLMTREDLMSHLKNETKVFENESVEKAFGAVDRADFVPDDYKVEAYEDYAIPIGEGQTISQPTTVAFMLELLDAKEGEKVLDVGSGSGWTTALLAEIVGKDGEVYSTELRPELVEMGRNNLKKYSLKNAEIFPATKELGLTEHQPYDRILVSADSDEMPSDLINQLKDKGTIVIPIGGVLTKAVKNGAKLEKKEFPGFAFVPLISYQDEDQ